MTRWPLSEQPLNILEATQNSCVFIGIYDEANDPRAGRADIITASSDQLEINNLILTRQKQVTLLIHVE